MLQLPNVKQTASHLIKKIKRDVLDWRDKT